MKVGIVLGAGGPVGWAYHLGVLEGVRSTLGHEPGQAARLVGTSAGGAVAASVLAGSSTDDVLRAITAPLTPEQREEMGVAFRRTRRPWRLLRPQAPRLIRRGGVVGLVGLLPAGLFPTAPLRRFPTAGLDGWPERLWMPAVRLDDGELVVFGRDRTDIAVSDALEATSAVPGMFQPKRIGNERFLDGAVASATHADLLDPARPGGDPTAGPAPAGPGDPCPRAGRHLDPGPQPDRLDHGGGSGLPPLGARGRAGHRGGRPGPDRPGPRRARLSRSAPAHRFARPRRSPYARNTGPRPTGPREGVRDVRHR